MGNKPVSIVLVEDDLVDARAVKRAFARSKSGNQIIHALNGRQALDMLRGEKGYVKLAKPYLIVLDLKMPQMGGHEFLTELRADEELKDSTVFVLTTSDAPSDRAKAEENQVDRYLVKAELAGDYSELVELIDENS